jgi:hypothetical protein
MEDRIGWKEVGSGGWMMGTSTARRDETAQLLPKGGALYPAAGAPRPRCSTPARWRLSAWAGDYSCCIRASAWHSRPRYRSRPTRPTCGVYAHESPPASLELGSFQLQALGSLRYARDSPPAFHPHPCACTPSRCHHGGTGLLLWNRSCGFARHRRPAVAHDGTETRVRRGGYFSATTRSASEIGGLILGDRSK